MEEIHNDRDELCIGMAWADNPSGEFIADENPILPNDVIDPHVFVDETGHSYLFWKEDNNGVWPILLLNLLHAHHTLLAELFTNEKDRVTVLFVVTILPSPCILSRRSRL